MITALSQDQELLVKFANKDKKAAETIYKDNYNMVHALVINNSGTTDDARDIFQEAMMVLYEKARSGNLELNCQLKTYLYSVSWRLWLKRLQQAKRYKGDLEDNDELIDVEDDLAMHEQQNEEFHLMEKAMKQLGEPCKSLLEDYYLNEKRMTDIADSFGYTNADNAKNQKYKCLLRLKKLFFAQYKIQ